MSEIRATTISDAAGTGPIALTGQSAAKAWVNYNQSTPTINDSFNVTSAVDNATGDATVNLTNSFANSTYSINTSCNEANTNSTANLSNPYLTGSSASQFKVFVVQVGSATSTSGRDSTWVASVHGDLA